MNLKKALVITPTTGDDKLINAIMSVKMQTVPCQHLIVVDGEKFKDKTFSLLYRNGYNEDPDVSIAVLPFNTGGGGFYGHRVMAAFAHLHDYQYTLFLDQDNMYKTTHVEDNISLIEQKAYKFTFSLRTIHDEDMNYICEDNCESLGMTPIMGDEKNGYLVDTSAYCYETKFLSKVSQLWHHGWGADRRFFEAMRSMTSMKGKYGCTNNYTLMYRLGGNEGSVTAEFFIEGNKRMEALK